MDSLTQAMLGAAVGYAVAGRKQPRKALLYGALAGTLPDLDVLIQYQTPVDDFTRHRGFTHSWIVQTLVAPVFAWGLAKLDRSFNFTTWFWLIWLCFITHAGLDAMTVYGTQLWWPLDFPPVMGGSVFIIDPTYTLPLFLLFLWILARPRAGLNYRFATIVLALTTTYLGASLLLKAHMEERLGRQLAAQGIEASRYIATAAPFNILLWRVIAVNHTEYYQGFASVLDDDQKIDFITLDRGADHLEQVRDNPHYQRLDWFSHGFHAAELIDGKIVIKDLRMGSEPAYVFRFAIAEQTKDGWNGLMPLQLPEPEIPARLFKDIWERIWNPEHRIDSQARAVPKPGYTARGLPSEEHKTQSRNIALFQGHWSQNSCGIDGIPHLNTSRFTWVSNYHEQIS